MMAFLTSFMRLSRWWTLCIVSLSTVSCDGGSLGQSALQMCSCCLLGGHVVNVGFCYTQIALIRVTTDEAFTAYFDGRKV